jgi:hypothetical protein
MVYRTWTDEEINYLKSLCEQKLRWSEIATLMKKKECCVCSKAHRMKFLKSKVIYHHSEETKAKLRECKLGEKNPMWKKGRIGKMNPMWSGDYVSYKSLHQWVRRHKPKISFCEECNKSESYDVANISGEYKRDINDFQWLCRRCHMQKDSRIKNFMIPRFSTAIRDSNTGRFIG